MECLPSPRALRESADPDQRRTQRLLELLDQRDAAGVRTFSEAEIVTYVVALCRASGGLGADGWEMNALLARFARLAGVTAADTDESVVRKLDELCRAHPPRPALVRAAAALLREEATAAAAPSPAFASFSAEPAVATPAQTVERSRAAASLLTARASRPASTPSPPRSTTPTKERP